jgi:glucose/arabinose dehydrogenase
VTHRNGTPAPRHRLDTARRYGHESFVVPATRESRCHVGVRLRTGWTAAFVAATLALALSGAPAAEQAAPVLPTPGASTVLRSRLASAPAAEVPLKVPPGFRVGLYAEGLSVPREMVQLASGDVLVVESGAGRVRRLRDRNGDGKAETAQTWVEGLKRPYGIAAHRGYVYVASAASVVRFIVSKYGRAGKPEEVIPLITYEGQELWGHGHWTRDILFSPDGHSLFLSVGSSSNNDDGEPKGRAAILRYDADGKNPRLYATGLRNPVSIAWRPGTDEMWTTVNERDRLGNDLVPDFVTHVQEGGFYGWPYFYIGPHPDPRHAGKHPELAATVIVPDVLIQAHSAALGIAFYQGEKFPAEYRGGLFVGLHGSWNRDPLVGYKVVWIPFRDGKPDGPPRDFLTGFIKDEHSGEVYGRPVAPFVLQDGSLLVSDDEVGRIWRVSWEGTSDSQ